MMPWICGYCGGANGVLDACCVHCLVEKCARPEPATYKEFFNGGVKGNFNYLEKY